MKLKTRLIIAFLTVILIPILLTATIACLFGKYQMIAIEKGCYRKNKENPQRRVLLKISKLNKSYFSSGVVPKKMRPVVEIGAKSSSSSEI